MIKKIITILTCLAIGVALFIPRPSRADDELTVLRIAATLALEVGGHSEGLAYVGAVLQERMRSQNGKSTWADLLYAPNQFEHSRGFASKSKEDLKIYIENKAGKSKWANVMHMAKKVYSNTADTSILKKTYSRDHKVYTINSFMVNYKGEYAEKRRDSSGKWTQTYTLYSHVIVGNEVDYFYAALGTFSKMKESKNEGHLHFDDNAPTNIDYRGKGKDLAIVNQYITGRYARKKGASSIDVNDIPEGSYDTSYNGESSGGGSSSSATPQKRPEGYKNRDQCALPEMQKIYMTSNGEDGTACWYCKVVIILANAYLQAASKAIPSAVGLGKIILKFGFLIWLAYYILQQVSSFAPVKISKVIQDVLVMGFKVALAYFIMDSAQTFIVNYFIDPIGTFGTDYGSALFDKLHSTSG